MYSEMKNPTPIDFEIILNDPINKKYRSSFGPEVITFMCEDPYSRVLMVNGEPVFVGGLTFYWKGRAKVWSLFSSKSKYSFLPVFRLIKQYLDDMNVKRIEMDVPFLDDRLKKRAEMLGFTKYADRARCYNSFGEDCTLYERINDGC